MKLDEAGRQRAAAAFRKKAKGRSPQAIAGLADIPDPATVRAFLDGASWPRSTTRAKLERAFGFEPGELEAIARGDVDSGLGDVDPVIDAIDHSPLVEWRKDAVRSTYRKHLYEQEHDERGTA